MSLEKGRRPDRRRAHATSSRGSRASTAVASGMPDDAAGVRAAAGRRALAGGASRLHRGHRSGLRRVRSCRRSSRASRGRSTIRTSRASRSSATRRGFCRPTPRRTCSSSSSTNKLDRLPADRAARRRSAWRAMLERHEPQARRGRRAPRADRVPRGLGVHGREGRGERRHGGRASPSTFRSCWRLRRAAIPRALRAPRRSRGLP